MSCNTPPLPQSMPVIAVLTGLKGNCGKGRLMFVPWQILSALETKQQGDEIKGFCSRGAAVEKASPSTCPRASLEKSTMVLSLAFFSMFSGKAVRSSTIITVLAGLLHMHVCSEIGLLKASKHSSCPVPCLWNEGCFYMMMWLAICSRSHQHLNVSTALVSNVSCGCSPFCEPRNAAMLMVGCILFLQETLPLSKNVLERCLTALEDFFDSIGFKKDDTVSSEGWLGLFVMMILSFHSGVGWADRNSKALITLWSDYFFFLLAELHF